jgi:hypothetical protein
VHLNRKRHPPQSSAVSKIESVFQENAEVKTGNALGSATYRNDIG